VGTMVGVGLRAGEGVTATFRAGDIGGAIVVGIAVNAESSASLWDVATAGAGWVIKSGVGNASTGFNAMRT